MNRLKNLENVAISASVDSQGRLSPVGGWTFKWEAAYREQGFPQISAVVISSAQKFDVTGLEERKKGHIYKVRDTRFYVLCADSIDQARTLLLNVQRQQGLADSPVLEDVPYFTGRTRLTSEVGAFIGAHRTGYLVISGGMGRGKTSFLRHYIYRRCKKTGEPQVCHFVGLAGTLEAKRQRIAQSLCLQLLNKYPPYEEPEDQRKEADWPMRLQGLLQGLSTSEFCGRKTPEVLFIDAADQAEVDEHGLVPGVLGELPQGCLCIVTTRPEQDWLKHRVDITLLPFDKHTNDRTDCGDCLRSRKDELGLTDKHINDITHHSKGGPVFFTVEQCIRTLKTGTPEERDKLRGKVEPWLQGPEALIEIQSDRLESWAEPKGIGIDTLWETLGMLALAQEPLSKDQLQALGLWKYNQTPAILGQAVNFFKPRTQTARADQPFIFDHPGYQRSVLARLGEVPQCQIHQRLADSCARWRALWGTAQAYALRYLPTHAQAARNSEQLKDALTDVEYLQARLAQDPEEGLYALLGDYQDALASHLLRGEPYRAVKAVYETIDADPYYISEYPDYLVPQLYNRLSFEWDESTALGRHIREAVKQHPYPWLKQLAPLPQLPWSNTCWGYTGRVEALAVLPDGQLASGGRDGTVRLWDLATGELFALWVCPKCVLGFRVANSIGAGDPVHFDVITDNGPDSMPEIYPLELRLPQRGYRLRSEESSSALDYIPSIYSPWRGRRSEFRSNSACGSVAVYRT